MRMFWKNDILFFLFLRTMQFRETMRPVYGILERMTQGTARKLRLNRTASIVSADISAQRMLKMGMVQIFLLKACILSVKAFMKPVTGGSILSGTEKPVRIKHM